VKGEGNGSNGGDGARGCVYVQGRGVMVLCSFVVLNASSYATFNQAGHPLTFCTPPPYCPYASFCDPLVSPARPLCCPPPTATPMTAWRRWRRVCCQLRRWCGARCWGG
jgi:hypothetical protein